MKIRVMDMNKNEIKVINGDNVKRIEADKTHIKIYYQNGLHEYYLIEAVNVEIDFEGR